MKITKQQIYIVLGISLMAIGGITIYRKYFSMSKDDAIAIILNTASGATKEALSAMGDQYLIARATAIKQGNSTYALDGKIYDTKTGKAK